MLEFTRYMGKKQRHYFVIYAWHHQGGELGAVCTEGGSCIYDSRITWLPSATKAFLRWITMGLIWAGILVFLPPARTDIVTLYLIVS
jgi:hypothetical protein